MDILEKGQRVQVVLPYSHEHLSYGIITHYDPEMGWYSVTLERTVPPFRGYYMRGDLEKVYKVDITIPDRLMEPINIISKRRSMSQEETIIFLLIEAIDDMPGDSEVQE